ncbi:hypothetical protein [Lacihabitans soyangensis]|uniref:Uncharacterized protein n=1 Tax=Lacihabitans soyangensis TaxID=869394 RepID=A0AAE3H3M7_9BACT|nr:hypothetical protein [Lacihabitans soyangensis]MCP9763466.1 hypothetical protein [Lacihabitans soyangensis]
MGEENLNQVERIEINQSIFDSIINRKDIRYFKNESSKFDFRNTLFIEKIRIETGSSLFSISFGENTVFQDDLIIASELVSGLEISDNCLINGNLRILGCRENFQFVILNGFLKKNFEITNIQTWGLLIQKFEIIGDFTIQNSTFNNIKIPNISVGGIMRIKNTTAQKISIGTGLNKTKVNRLLLEDVTNLEIGGTLSDLSINEIEFNSNSDRNLIMNFKNIQIQKLKFLNFLNNGIINFENIRGLNSSEYLSLSIVSSDLGNINFADCNFSNFRFLVIASKFQNMFLTGSEFCKPEQIDTINELSYYNNSISTLSQFKQMYERNGDIFSSSTFLQKELELREIKLNPNDFKEKKDIYSQLKKMYEQRGDSVKSLEYQAKELDIYRKSISWGSHFFEKFNLSINRFTNNYGTNWALALLVTILINSVFFTWYCILLGFTFDIQGKYFWELFSYSFEFLNPLRKADFIPNMKVSPGARIVDYSARILVTLCVYQLIQAFRKYGKK